ncbi:MAG TPA: hypothetical protein VN605_11050 [Thermoanaerobaculia bacterium]|nr:hypothetical protein [Thermoanaerobaculia bacterium]
MTLAAACSAVAPRYDVPHMNFAKRVFRVAGIYGLVVLVPQYFMESKIGRDFPPAITHPEHFYGFVGVALAWQVLFFVIARDPVRYRGAIVPAILEKLAFGIAAIVLFAQGRLALPVLGAGIIDLILAALFFLSLRKLPRAFALSDAR